MKFTPGKKPSDHYGSFSRRMWAATIDSILILIIFSPIFAFGFDHLYGPPQASSFNILDFQQQMANQTSGAQALQSFWQYFKESGEYHRWLANTTLQTLLLALLTGYCWRRWSATPGKMLLKMKVVDAETEAPLSDRQIMWRLFGYIVSTIPLFAGFYWIGLNKRRRGWHDLIAGTVVIVVPKAVTPDSEAVRP